PRRCVTRGLRGGDRGTGSSGSPVRGGSARRSARRCARRAASPASSRTTSGSPPALADLRLVLDLPGVIEGVPGDTARGVAGGPALLAQRRAVAGPTEHVDEGGAQVVDGRRLDAHLPGV